MVEQIRCAAKSFCEYVGLPLEDLNPSDAQLLRAHEDFQIDRQARATAQRALAVTSRGRHKIIVRQRYRRSRTLIHSPLLASALKQAFPGHGLPRGLPFVDYRVPVFAIRDIYRRGEGSTDGQGNKTLDQFDLSSLYEEQISVVEENLRWLNDRNSSATGNWPSEHVRERELLIKKLREINQKLERCWNQRLSKKEHDSNKNKTTTAYLHENSPGQALPHVHLERPADGRQFKKIRGNARFRNYNDQSPNGTYISGRNVCKQNEELGMEPAKDVARSLTRNMEILKNKGDGKKVYSGRFGEPSTKVFTGISNSFGDESQQNECIVPINAQGNCSVSSKQSELLPKVGALSTGMPSGSYASSPSADIPSVENNFSIFQFLSPREQRAVGAGILALKALRNMSDGSEASLLTSVDDFSKESEPVAKSHSMEDWENIWGPLGWAQHVARHQGFLNDSVQKKNTETLSTNAQSDTKDVLRALCKLMFGQDNFNETPLEYYKRLDAGCASALGLGATQPKETKPDALTRVFRPQINQAILAMKLHDDARKAYLPPSAVKLLSLFCNTDGVSVENVPGHYGIDPAQLARTVISEMDALIWQSLSAICEARMKRIREKLPSFFDRPPPRITEVPQTWRNQLQTPARGVPTTQQELTGKTNRGVSEINAREVALLKSLEDEAEYEGSFQEAVFLMRNKLNEIDRRCNEGKSDSSPRRDDSSRAKNNEPDISECQWLRMKNSFSRRGIKGFQSIFEKLLKIVILRRQEEVLRGAIAAALEKAKVAREVDVVFGRNAESKESTSFIRPGRITNKHRRGLQQKQVEETPRIGTDPLFSAFQAALPGFMDEQMTEKLELLSKNLSQIAEINRRKDADASGLDESLKHLYPGKLVMGEVVSIRRDRVQVRLSCGRICDLKIEDVLLPGEDISRGLVNIFSVGQKSWFIVFRCTKKETWLTVVPLRQLAAWEALIHAEKHAEPIVALVEQVLPVAGIRGIVPAFHLSNGLSDFTSTESQYSASSGFSGAVQQKAILLHVLQADPLRRRLVLSQRLLETRKQVATKQIGSLVEASVVSVHPFGAVLQFGACKGLLHVSEVSAARVDSLERLFKPGGRVMAILTAFDEATGKIGLSTRLLEAYPGEMLIDPVGVFQRAPNVARGLQQQHQKQKEERVSAVHQLMQTLGMNMPEDSQIKDISKERQKITGGKTSFEGKPNGNMRAIHEVHYHNRVEDPSIGALWGMLGNGESELRRVLQGHLAVKEQQEVQENDGDRHEETAADERVEEQTMELSWSRPMPLPEGGSVCVRLHTPLPANPTSAQEFQIIKQNPDLAHMLMRSDVSLPTIDQAPIHREEWKFDACN